MKKSLLLRNASLAGLAVMLMAFSACDPCKKNPCLCAKMPQDNRSFSEQVRDYLTRNQGEVDGGIVDGKYAAYFDRSDDLTKYAFKIPSIKANVHCITNMVANNSNSFEVFSLEAEKVNRPMDNMTTTEFFNNILYTQFTGIKAPIKEAMKQIVEQKKPALLVSDLEEYEYDNQLKKNTVIDYAYAAEYFKPWIEMGGVIKFYIMDFDQNRPIKKKLFFVVFDKDWQLTKKIDYALEMSGAGKDTYTEFKLDPAPYKVFTDYSVGKGGNFVQSNGRDPFGFEYSAIKDKNIEIYSTSLRSWLQMAEEVMSYRAMPNENYTGLLSKLYVDLSDMQSRNISKVDTKVYDITADFESYTNNQLALRYAPTKADDGSITLDCEQAFFYDINGALLSNYEYKPVDVKDVTDEEFLQVKQDIFNHSFSVHPEKTEIVIDFGKKFSDSTMFKNDMGGYELLKRDQLKDKMNGRILKVDVCVAESGVVDRSQLEQDFSFTTTLPDGKVGPNTSIVESVKETQNPNYDGINPTGRVIYTFIIKDNADAD